MQAHPNGSRTRMSRLLLALVLGAIAGCSRGACDSTHRSATSSSSTPRHGGTVVVAIPSEPKSLMPYSPQAQGPPASSALQLVLGYMTMTKADLISYAPQLATRWEWEADGKSLTFHLRDDARWEDGVPVTAADVQFSFEVARDTLVGWPSMSWKSDIEACEVIDPHTVRYRFRHVPREAERFAREGFVIPKHILGEVPRDQWAKSDYARHPVGCGPFRLESWEPAQRLVFVRSSTYWDAELPYLDRIVFRIVPDPATRIQLLRAGEVDFVEDPSARDVEQLRSSGSPVRILTCKGRVYDYLAFNLHDPLFASVRVREALTRGIDREGIVGSLLRDQAEPLDGPIVPALWAYDPDLPRVPYDPQGARRLLEEEGWRDTDGDGWLDRDGRRFDVTVQLVNDNEIRRSVVVAVQSQWKDIGVQAEVQMLERSTLNQHRIQGLFQVLYAGWSTNIAMDLAPIWACNGRNNFIGYCNSRVDSLAAVATMQPYDAARPSLYAAQRLIAGDCPYVFLYSLFNVVGTSARLRNVEFDTRDTFLNPESWWVVDAGAP